MIIAHRGVHNNKKGIPENSMLAFKKAIDKNYAIEFDIEITKDDILVIHHDDNLLRMTGVNKSVEDLTYSEIKELRLLDTKEIIPTFKELLNLVDGKVFLDIEVKSTKRVSKVVELILKELENYKGKLSLKSFDPKIVNKLKKETNKYKIGLLVMKTSKNKKLNLLVKSNLIYHITKFDFLAVHKVMFDKDYYNKYKDKYPLFAWTFNGIIEAEEFMKEYPDVTCICNDLD